MYDDEDDDFKITMQFQEDEVRMDKKRLTKKSRIETNPNNLSALSDNRSVLGGGNLNQAFIDKSRVDTSNLIADDGNILGYLALNKSNNNCNLSTNSINMVSTNECSKCKWLMNENRRKEEIIKKYNIPLEVSYYSLIVQNQNKDNKQKLFDSFGAENEKPDDDLHLNIHDDLVISGCNIKNPNTFEIKNELSILEKSIGNIGHNRSLSNIKYPSNHKRMESAIQPKDVFDENLGKFINN